MAGPFASDLPRVTGHTGGALTLLMPYGVVCWPGVTLSANAWRSRSGSIVTTLPVAFSAAMSASVRLAAKPLMAGNSRRSRSSAETLESNVIAAFAATRPVGFSITMTACVGTEANAVSGAMNNRAAKAARIIRSWTSLFLELDLGAIANGQRRVILVIPCNKVARTRYGSLLFATLPRHD